MAKMHIKTGDIVQVISGASKYKKLSDGTEIGVKKGEVIAVSPAEGKVLVKGANIIHKHVKARRQGETSAIVDTEGAIYACKVALYCPECKKGVRTHIEMVDGKKVRVCSGKRDGKPCGHKFD